MPVFVTSGNFWVCPALGNGDRDVGNEILLDPNPTNVEYGERLNHTLQTSLGRTIKQWSATNPEPKKWVWENYGTHVPKYEAQYQLLYNMQEHINVYVNSGSPYVYLKEDTTDGLSVYSGASLVPAWGRCRVLMVSRTTRTGGGIPVYADTEFVFTIDDPSFVTY